MEDNIQRVFTILISVVIFFLLPLYMAFEKKDDISYALALKITTAFVDEVTNKGYLTEDMYSDYISNLQVTANTYNVTFEHIAKKYYPVINTYESMQIKEDGSYSYNNLQSIYFDFQQYHNEYENNQDFIKSKISEVLAGNTTGNTISTLNEKIDSDTWKHNDKEAKINLEGKEYKYLELGYRLQEEKHYTDEILSKIKNRYTMNQGDEFTVIIKNENTTIATVLFNSLTFGANSGNDTKVYVNYGGTIKNVDWLEKGY